MLISSPRGRSRCHHWPMWASRSANAAEDPRSNPCTPKSTSQAASETPWRAYWDTAIAAVSARSPKCTHAGGRQLLADIPLTGAAL